MYRSAKPAGRRRTAAHDTVLCCPRRNLTRGNLFLTPSLAKPRYNEEAISENRELSKFSLLHITQYFFYFGFKATCFYRYRSSSGLLYRFLKERQNVAFWEISQISQYIYIYIYYNTIGTLIESHAAVKLCQSV
jgi:hypothetical protein